MAQLQYQDGKIESSLPTIQKLLMTIGVQLSHWPLPENPELKTLLNKENLADVEKEQVLNLLNERFEQQKADHGYQTQDLVCLTPKTPNIDELLAKFDKIHTHSDDEVRYIVDGSGIFGFVLKDNSQILLRVDSSEYIRIPENTEHWFLLDENKRIKAVRYFISTEGWVANYTNKEVHIG